MSFFGLEGSRSNDKFYEVLNVPKTATPDEIKKAYRKRALTCHPDKHPDKGDEFRELSAAYEVLSDPNKRRIYDKFGEQGLNMLAMGVFGEDGSQTLLPTLLTSPIVMVLLLCCACLLPAVACIFPLLFALKWDDNSLMPWNNVFIPVWVVSAIAIIAMLVLIAAPWFIRLLIWSRVFAVVGFFICLNLSLSVLDTLTTDPAAFWSGWEVFAPLFVFEALSLLSNAIFMGVSLTAFRTEREQGFRRSNLGLSYLGWLLRRFLTPLLRLAVWCTMAGAIDDRAGLLRPLLPLGLLVGWLTLTAMCDQYVLTKKAALDGDEVPPSPTWSAFQRGCVLLLWGTLLMVWAGLYLAYMNSLVTTSLVVREVAETPWTAVVSFTTVWIASLAMILVCCCICMCGSCAVCAQGAMDIEEVDGETDGAENNKSEEGEDGESVGAMPSGDAGGGGFKSADGSTGANSDGEDEKAPAASPKTSKKKKKSADKEAEKDAKKATPEESIDSIEDVD